jgi:hypothetical protein
MRHRCTIIVILLTASIAAAVEIEGVQPAALDQPRVHVHLRRDPKGKPLEAAGIAGESTIDFTAFLDTGASGILLSKTTADALGVKPSQSNGKPTTFTDIGVGGDENFGVSEPLFIYLAPSRPSGAPDDPAGYPTSLGPVRLQLGAGAGLLESLTGGLDVVGMPVIKGHVVVLDPRAVDSFGDIMNAGLFDRRTKRGANDLIPKTDRHIKLSYQSFKRFTRTDPPAADGPTLADNPFIDDIQIARGARKSAGRWLLDTGAAASMISSAQAAKVGIKYVKDTEHTDAPQLEGVPEDQQFTMTIGGVGGTQKVAGFFLDTLTLPTRERDPLLYKRAPVMVCDITVEDIKTKEKLTLDGIFGMNFLVASARVTEGGPIPDIGKLTKGPFEWIVIDEPAAVLGLKLK